MRRGGRRIAAIGALVALVTAMLFVSGLTATSPDYRAVVDVSTRAMQATQQVPTQAFVRSNGLVGQTNEQIIALAEAQFRDLYTGSVLARKLAIVDGALGGQLTEGATIDDAGMADVVVTSVTIDGNHASVQASGTGWATFTQQVAGHDPVTARPQNVTDWTFTLVKAGDKWLIESEDWTFAPGSEP